MGRWERLGLRLHLLMCRHCRRYARQLRALTSATRQWADAFEPDLATVQRVEQRIQRAAKERYPDHADD